MIALEFEKCNSVCVYGAGGGGGGCQCGSVRRENGSP